MGAGERFADVAEWYATLHIAWIDYVFIETKTYIRRWTRPFEIPFGKDSGKPCSGCAK